MRSQRSCGQASRTYEHLRNAAHSASEKIFERPRGARAVVRFLNRLRHGDATCVCSKLESRTSSERFLDRQAELQVDGRESYRINLNRERSPRSREVELFLHPKNARSPMPHCENFPRHKRDLCEALRCGVSFRDRISDESM